MKNILYLLLLTSLSGFSQILSINDAADPESEFSLQELVENILISGDCAEVNNFTEQVSGSETQTQTKSYGYFTRPAGSSFPFEEGIIITSGRAFPAGNASNTADPYPSFDNNLPGDTDLETALNINATEDATFVKFNFVPTTPELSFRFIMASEEYNGNSECTYTDSLAFLLREVGTTTYTNLAVLPGGTPVSVTNINRASGCAANVNYFEGYNLPHTNYGGQTTAITATATVTPNQTYEIKLVVSDQGDPSYDSAIFLEAGGFNIGLDLGQDQTVSGGNPACSNETLVLNTQIPATTSPHTWFLDGVELVGENNATLNVTTAGIYSVSVDLGTTCSATDSIEIEFQTPPVANSIPNQLACDDMTNDGFENFDLLALNSFILGSQSASDFTVSYHKNLTDAESGANPLGDNYTNQTANQIETLVARIEDNTYGCFNTTSFSIDVFQRPIISDYLYNLCDDGADGPDASGECDA